MLQFAQSMKQCCLIFKWLTIQLGLVLKAKLFTLTVFILAKRINTRQQGSLLNRTNCIHRITSKLFLHLHHVVFQCSQSTEWVQIVCECRFSNWNVPLCYLASSLSLSNTEQFECPLTSRLTHFCSALCWWSSVTKGKSDVCGRTQWKRLVAVLSNINKRAEEQTYCVSAQLGDVIHVSKRPGTRNSNVTSSCFIQSVHFVLGQPTSRALSRQEICRKCDTAAHIYMLPELVPPLDSWVLLNWVHLSLQGSYKRCLEAKWTQHGGSSGFHHKDSGWKKTGDTLSLVSLFNSVCVSLWDYPSTGFYTSFKKWN